MQLRVGVGYDSHRLIEGRPLVIGGVLVPFEQGLMGHSDGDVLLHAIGDAILGAAGLPNIGQLFPDTDASFKNADSWELLREISNRAQKENWRVVNIDCVLIAQRPKISPHVLEMRARIAAALEIEMECVNVKGKTAENLGALGQGLGMASHAVCLLQRD